jgi:hypothetical protein
MQTVDSPREKRCLHLDHIQTYMQHTPSFRQTLPALLPARLVSLSPRQKHYCCCLYLFVRSLSLSWWSWCDVNGCCIEEYDHRSCTACSELYAMTKRPSRPLCYELFDKLIRANHLLHVISHRHPVRPRFMLDDYTIWLIHL